MSLFIGSAPRLAERHRLRCRLPSRHHAHDALLAPNSSPGVGRFSFAALALQLDDWRVSGARTVAASKFRRRRLRGAEPIAAKSFAKCLVDAAQLLRRPHQRSVMRSLEMPRERGIREHLRVQCRAQDLEAEHAIARDDGRAIRRARPAWPSRRPASPARHSPASPSGRNRPRVLGRSRHDQVGTVAGSARLGDDVARPIFHPLGLPRDLGELQRASARRKSEGATAAPRGCRLSCRQASAIRLRGSSVRFSPPPRTSRARGARFGTSVESPLTARACSRLSPSPAARRARGPSRSSGAADRCASPGCAW